MNTPTPRTDAFERLLDRCYPSGFDRNTGIFHSWPDYARQLETELAAAQERIKALEVNDARYRWLRDGIQGAQSADGKGPLVVMDEPTRIPRYIGPLMGKHLDAAIDAARKEAERG